MNDDTGLALLHGAGLGSFIWTDLQPLLDCAPLAIDFPNTNADGKANAGLTFHVLTKSAVEKIEIWDRKSMLAVGISML